MSKGETMRVAPMRTRWRATLIIEHDDKLSDEEIADAIKRLAFTSLIFGKRTPRSKFDCRATLHRVDRVQKITSEGSTQ